MFDWMVWTLPTAVFFICIGLMLVVMTMWELKSPTTLRKGFLPIATTRGDRLFIGLLVAAYINLGFLGLAGGMAGRLGMEQEPSVWISFVVSMLVLALILRKG
jgi:predicted small integral membrane protein